MDRGEFEKIFHLTSKRGIYLMTDECYCKFLYDSEPFFDRVATGREGDGYWWRVHFPKPMR